MEGQNNKHNVGAQKRKQPRKQRISFDEFKRWQGQMNLVFLGNENEVLTEVLNLLEVYERMDSGEVVHTPDEKRDALITLLKKINQHWVRIEEIRGCIEGAEASDRAFQALVDEQTEALLGRHKPRPAASSRPRHNHGNQIWHGFFSFVSGIRKMAQANPSDWLNSWGGGKLTTWQTLMSKLDEVGSIPNSLQDVLKKEDHERVMGQLQAAEATKDEDQLIWARQCALDQADVVMDTLVQYAENQITIARDVKGGNPSSLNMSSLEDLEASLQFLQRCDKILATTHWCDKILVPPHFSLNHDYFVDNAALPDLLASLIVNIGKEKEVQQWMQRHPDDQSISWLKVHESLFKLVDRYQKGVVRTWRNYGDKGNRAATLRQDKLKLLGALLNALGEEDCGEDVNVAKGRVLRFLVEVEHQGVVNSTGMAYIKETLGKRRRKSFISDFAGFIQHWMERAFGHYAEMLPTVVSGARFFSNLKGTMKTYELDKVLQDLERAKMPKQ
jgi:hypothetical protein